ncbi:MarR family transcriptional regulator [Microbaculum marinum]|uniref:MarR family transcriptional regulator n=1 Tax=Microbaculum marinum TaxID=1764581 RepID=A0AAW9RMW7_9HYPH
MTETPPPSLGLLIADVFRLMRRRFDEKSKDTGLTRAQWQLLARLSKSEGINQAGLADLLDMEPMSVCRLVDRMEESGWVTRKPDPADRRARRLFLTQKARPALEDMKPVVMELFDEAMEGLDPSEREQLLAALTVVRANLARSNAQTAEYA